METVASTKGWDPPRGPGWGRTAEDQWLQVNPCHRGVTVSSHIPNWPSQPSLFLFNSVLKAFTLWLRKHPSTLSGLRVLASRSPRRATEDFPRGPQGAYGSIDFTGGVSVSQQISSQINGFHRGSKGLGRCNGAPRAAQRSKDYTGGVGSQKENAEPASRKADRRISPKICGTPRVPW